MFGKINFGISKPEQGKSKPNFLSNKPQLSNPKYFGNKQKSNQTTNNTSKVNVSSDKKVQNKAESKPYMIQKTKQIKKDIKTQVIAKQSSQQIIQGSKFRILNQLLYTNSSQYAMQYFKQNQQDYQIYHKGYRVQAQKWQSKPVNLIVKYLRKNYTKYKNQIICDLGCGEGFLYQELTRQTFDKDFGNKPLNKPKNKHVFNKDNIKSFDLVSLKSFIQVADIKNLPIHSQSTDLVVFCLSLMGKNYLQFIYQALRILKFNGELIIAQVQSRSKNWRSFVEMIQLLGFRLINNGISLWNQTSKQEGKVSNTNQGKYFRIMQFQKIIKQQNQFIRLKYQGKMYTQGNVKELAPLLLAQCIYKKR